MGEIDAVRLNFNPASLVALNAILALVLFGVALDMRPADFKGIGSAPKATVIGLLGQFLLLPAIAYGLARLLEPAPSIALGMILVAACPGGNISNFLTHHARGNTALSITISAFSTIGSLIFTPFNLSFWGSLDPGTRAILHAVALSPLEVLLAIVFLLSVPASWSWRSPSTVPCLCSRSTVSRSPPATGWRQRKCRWRWSGFSRLSRT